ncbi:uncharacterized protein LOC116182556 [Photinus pyralis]|uniref:uncharacterized protein LOC116182556 n=1 Tax=Photinus pyralis TaxID=7054 RepID=UPI0012677A59|nr:uncharacterized protein LOC116182556 [Photinus pyralis]
MSRFGCDNDEKINEIIESNTPRNTVYSKKFVWKAFMDFCSIRNYELDGSRTVEELASILKDWAVNMRRKDGMQFKEATVKTMWNVTMLYFNKRERPAIVHGENCSLILLKENKVL